MPTYRFYVLKPDGKIEAASDQECADDNAVLALARQMIAHKFIEVWQRARQVFHLDPSGTVGENARG